MIGIVLSGLDAVLSAQILPASGFDYVCRIRARSAAIPIRPIRYCMPERDRRSKQRYAVVQACDYCRSLRASHMRLLRLRATPVDVQPRTLKKESCICHWLADSSLSVATDRRVEQMPRVYRWP
jgi:hypothetical protein